ncbi:SdpI family protein [Rhodococcus spelaei]|uniref:SdpI family protein n=1 Tax=Rhodococcus spelaei TaxID=2546320 RepID=A0A541B197_9NOCA|nr:SdpI family protein [Rhodococcus spelaei]TQF66103.1 SdpI family protein [Rhodococcus spelaei]
MESLATHALIFLSLTGGGAVVIWVARAGARGRLRRNGFVGFRTPTTMASDEAWAAAHRAGGRLAEIGGWCLAAAGIATLFPVSESARTAVSLCGAILLGGFVAAGAWVGVRAARDIAPPDMER